MCLAPENAIFGNGRKPRRRRKKKVGKLIGDPIGGRDASITMTGGLKLHLYKIAWVYR